ncbi:hypothetical protein AB4392_01695 [Vibrio breoganii]
MKNKLLLKEFGSDTNQYERLLAVDSVSEAIIFGNIEVYFKYFQSPTELPEYLRALLPIRRVLKKCGLNLWVFDKYKAKNIRQHYNLTADARIDVDILKAQLLSSSFKVGKRYSDYRLARRKAVPRYEPEFCQISLGRCKCAKVTVEREVPSRGTSIGLGLKPVTEIKRIKSDEVEMDIHTMPRELTVKHHLYTEGWSLKGHFTNH